MTSVLSGLGDLSHVAGIFMRAHDRAGEQALPDRAGATMLPFCTDAWSHPPAAVALDDTFSLDLRGVDGVHEITRSKQRRTDGFHRASRPWRSCRKFLDAFTRDTIGVALLDREQRFGEGAVPSGHRSRVRSVTSRPA